jgi:penicillin-binding protein 2
MQAAIGQSDNRFTPMQICTYISTLANGGTRYSATLIKTIKSYDMSTVVQPDAENNKTILAKLDASATMLDIVKQGMLGVTEEGTASTTFENYQIKIGGKTGTADTDQSANDDNKTASPNAIFVAFAPYENPEIAVAVIGEKCGHGKVMAQVARDIFDEYFFSSKTSGYDILEEGGVSTWSDSNS